MTSIAKANNRDRKIQKRTFGKLRKEREDKEKTKEEIRRAREEKQALSNLFIEERD